MSITDPAEDEMMTRNTETQTATPEPPEAARRGAVHTLQLERVMIYASSGTGAGRATTKRVEVVGEYEPNGPGAINMSVIVRDASGRSFDMGIGYDGKPCSLRNQRAAYEVC